jgi:AraC-like DNA-binding protein
MSSSAALQVDSAPRRWAELALPTHRVRLFTSAPPPALAEDVEYLWWLEALEPLPAPVVRRCTSKAAVDVVLTLDGHFCERAERRLFASGRRAPYLVGPMSAWAEIVSTGRCTAVGARIRPGRAADLLRATAADLRDRVASLEDLCGPALRGAAGEPAALEPSVAIDRLEDVLLELRRRARAQDALVVEAVRLIERRRGAVTVEAVAGRLGSTSRQLERRFHDRVGLSPKRWCRVVRLDHAMGLLASGARTDFGDVVDACGFYDQAHLIRDFRELAGTTPGAFVRDRHACP